MPLSGADLQFVSSAKGFTESVSVSTRVKSLYFQTMQTEIWSKLFKASLA